MICEFLTKTTINGVQKLLELRLLLSCLWACHCLVRPLRGADYRTTNL